MMTLNVKNAIGRDALMFSSDNTMPNGLVVAKDATVAITKSMFSKFPVYFTAMDSTTKAMFYLNNLAKLRVEPTHSHDEETDVLLTISGTKIFQGTGME